MTGQTLLPMPMGIEQIFEAEWKAQLSGGAEVDVRLKSDIETIVTKWCSQIADTLNEENTRALVNDRYPLPSAGTPSFLFVSFCFVSFFSFFFTKSKNLRNLAV